MDFEKLSLHDAVLNEVSYEWGSKEAAFTGFLVGDRQLSFILKFSGVSSLVIPHENEWGPSSSINELIGGRPEFGIHMQSGDVIRVKADGFTFTTERT